MAAYRSVTVEVPEAHAKRIESVAGGDLATIVKNVILNWFSDERRRDIPVKRQGVSWSPDLYAAMTKHIGVGQISHYIRDAVYADLSKTEKDLLNPPEWKEGREAVRGKRKRKPANDRLSLQAPIIFPEQWIDRIEAKYPGKVSTYIKACVQMALEKQFKITIPLQKGLGMFINR